jgi:hypothetical protein
MASAATSDSAPVMCPVSLRERIDEKELAIKNYKKSLQLDPANQHAAIRLKQSNSQ